jgi:diketogulonate reductase-like aldo/keto reductase
MMDKASKGRIMPNAQSPSLSRAAFLRLLAGGGVAAGAVTATGLGRGVAKADQPLLTRPIPSSGEALPVVGLGTWQTFDIGAGEAERAPRREVLQILLEGGGKVIDSSPMYGRSEGVVGDLLAELGARERAFLATKVWTRGRAAGIAQMEQSLRRFRSERLELMQVHNLVDWQVHLKTLRAWKAEGRIRYLGITHYTTAALDDLAAVIEAEPLDFVQLAHSLAVRAAEDRLLPLAADKGVAVLVNRPYEKGALFRRVKGRALPPWAAEFGAATWGKFFLKYILSHPAVTCVIPGTAKPHHMLDNLGAGRGRLPDVREREQMVRFWEGL